MIQLGGKTFELAYENKNGWNFEAFRDRYSDVLDRYDYIVGDWGYNQLRLKGFFREGNPKGSKESSIASLQEYIQEYCNFGCAYFVLERIPSKKKNDHPGGGSDAKEGQRRQHHRDRDHSGQSGQQRQQEPKEAKEAKESNGKEHSERRRPRHRNDHNRQNRNKDGRNSKNA